jgi:hypothetical protein
MMTTTAVNATAAIGNSVVDDPTPILIQNWWIMLKTMASGAHLRTISDEFARRHQMTDEHRTTQHEQLVLMDRLLHSAHYLLVMPNDGNDGSHNDTPPLLLLRNAWQQKLQRRRGSTTYSDIVQLHTEIAQQQQRQQTEEQPQQQQQYNLHNYPLYPPRHVWGPAIWQLLHECARRLSINSSSSSSINKSRLALLLLIECCCKLLPCLPCRIHSSQWWSSRWQQAANATPEQLQQWLYQWQQESK